MKGWPKTFGENKKAQEDYCCVTSTLQISSSDLSHLAMQKTSPFAIVNLVSCAVLKRLRFNHNAKQQPK